MSMTDPLELLKPSLKNKFDKTYLDSKHVLKVYIKPSRKKKYCVFLPLPILLGRLKILHLM